MDAEDGTAIANVRFLVENSDGTQSAEITTDANSEYSILRMISGLGMESRTRPKVTAVRREYTLTNFVIDANKGKIKHCSIKLKIDSDECVFDLGDIVDERDAGDRICGEKNSEDGSKFIDPDAGNF